MGPTAGAGIATGLAGAVNAFYQGQDAQREQQMKDALFQQQQKEGQQNQQLGDMKMRQIKAQLDEEGGKIIYEGLVTGDLQGAVNRRNQLIPGDPISITTDPTNPDAMIVKRGSGTSVWSIPKFTALYGQHKNVVVSPGGTLVDPVTGQVKYTAPAAPQKPTVVPQGSSLVDPTGKQIFNNPKPDRGTNGLPGPKDANKVQTSDGQWKTEGELRQTFGQIYGSWDPVMQQYTINQNAPSYLTWRNQVVAPQFKWPDNSPSSGQYPWQRGLSSTPSNPPAAPPAVNGLTMPQSAPQGSLPASRGLSSPTGPQMPTPTSEQEYRALPKGTQYVAPDGSIRTKQ